MCKYILDDNRVRECAINIAKMNVLEYTYYSIFHWGYFKHSICKVFKYLLQAVEIILGLILEIVKIIIFPIFIAIYAVLCIRKNKKWIEKNFRRNYERN